MKNFRLFCVAVCLSAGFNTPPSNAQSSAQSNAQSTESQKVKSQSYDPFRILNKEEVKPSDLSIEDAKRKRTIPVRVYLPEKKSKVPVILFSHGLGGSRRGCGYLGKHWSARGYAVVFMQHAGSDESVWRDLPVKERMEALKGAPSAKNTFARFLDVKSVLDSLDKWNQTKGHEFQGRFDLEHVGMSGHSYGASTTQGVSGQSSPRLGQRYTDKRIDAAIMFSPNRPRRTEPKVAFGKVAIPWLLMTGTKDTSPINDTTVNDRRQVYPALPKSIDKYELVLQNAQHHAFSDGQGRRRVRDPNHHRAILALSTSFWDTYLAKNKNARKWLQGDGAKKVLKPDDQWQFQVGQSKKKESPNND